MRAHQNHGVSTAVCPEMRVLLADHLQKIMRAEKKMDTPPGPPTHLPKRQTTPIVGTVTSEVRELDMKYFSKVERIQEDAKELIKERGARGEGSM